MDKENKLIPEQEAKENEIVELKDEKLEIITAAAGISCDENITISMLLEKKTSP
ncbi:MAG: hypothetical protein MJ247_01125 [Alphaproteobacteria bacterium]|nr:hypothetical protein [Alphaproteobacteria bacterium]